MPCIDFEICEICENFERKKPDCVWMVKSMAAYKRHMTKVLRNEWIFVGLNFDLSFSRIREVTTPRLVKIKPLNRLLIGT